MVRTQGIIVAVTHRGKRVNLRRDDRVALAFSLLILAVIMFAFLVRNHG